MLKFEAHYWLILSELDVYQVPDKLHSVHQCAREEAFNSRVERCGKAYGHIHGTAAAD